MTETGFSTPPEHRDWWSRRPRRSRSDSKVAGVAGGLAHYLGVDPILFRVGFVALTILGGVGILAYSLLWLLLPAEGDEVSAGEALLGRGRSSVSPLVAAVLAVAVVISVFATLNWGFPFWPALVIGAIAFSVARKQRRGPFRPGSEWERRIRATADDVAANQWSSPAAAGPAWGDRGTTGGHQGWGSGSGAGSWGGWGSWGGGCSGHGQKQSQSQSQGHGHRPAEAAPETGDSPFDTPAFWDAPSGDAPPAGQPRVDLRKPAGPGTPTAAPSGASEPRTTPPAWDPLGAAPFAWDLPDVDLTPPSDVVSTRRTASPVIARATGGLAVLVIAASVLGILAGWWHPAWAVVSAAALSVVALGLFAQAVRGRSLSLIGPGVFLSIVTLLLTVAGFSGTPSFGDLNAAPRSAADVQREYRLSAGDAELDLSNLQLRPDEQVVTSLDLGAGDASVILPAGVAYTVTCASNAGPIDCLDQHADGLDRTVGPVTAAGGSASIDLDVHVGAGNLTVTVAR